MFIRSLRTTVLFGRRAMSTTPGQLPINVLSLHRNFPYTLHKVNPGERSSIVDPAATAPRSEHFYDRDEAEHLVEGRVYPTLTFEVKNGPMLFPNTHTFQHYSRMFMDQYYDSLDEGFKPIVPYIFQIPKGAPVPDSLILVHHDVGWFSLQPVKGLSLDEFNDALDGFYSNHAKKIVAEQWFEEHDYSSADPHSDPNNWD